MFEEALRAIRQYDTVIIHRHKNPDGDAMGSQAGLYNIIKDNYPQKAVYMVGDPSDRYGFIAGRPMDEIPDSLYENALAVILDTSAEALISDDRYKKAAGTLRIDHHLFISKIADIEIVDPSYESCAGLVTQMAIESGLKVSSEAASGKLVICRDPVDQFPIQAHPFFSPFLSASSPFLVCVFQISCH